MLIGIVCCGKNNEIGIGLQCCFAIPEDRQFFHKMIEGKTVVVGRITYATIPKKVLSKCKHVHILSASNPLPNEYITSDEPVMVIGGSKVYESLSDVTKEYYITHVNDSCKDADSFLNIDVNKYTQKNILQENDYYKIIHYS